MIRLTREGVSIPSVFASKEMEDERVKLAKFYRDSRAKRAQRRYRMNWKLRNLAHDAVAALSHGKCAYCETPLGEGQAGTIDSFRPKADALGLDGTASPDHYWWLTYEWSNLLAACLKCNQLKGRRFPVTGRRARLEATGDALRKEKLLLLDPFDDEPSEHLVFSEDGLVAGKSERGRVTIEVIGLNREKLVEARRSALRRFRDELKRLVHQQKFQQSELEALVSATEEYAAAKRQFMNSWLNELQREVGQALGENIAAAMSSAEAKSAAASPEEREQHFAKYRADQARQEAFSIDSDAEKADYFIRTRLLERIEIENFRPIEALDLTFPSPAEATPAAVMAQVPTSDVGEAARQASWLMLLGENGTGKSSVLQAVALCLLGNEWRKGMDLDARRFVREGAQSGSVRVHLTGSSTPITLTFSRDSEQFESHPGEPKMLLLGYGSTRLLPRPGFAAQPGFDFAQTSNLFHPFVPLGDADEWLLGLSKSVFETVAGDLKTLLQLTDEDRLVRVDKPERRVEVELQGTRVPLDELSDGYQSVLALTCDVMRVMLSKWPSMQLAEGLVILDEIGSHLHPTWRMRVVRSLRETFPRVQFLVSTHDPLCLRGLEEGEVTVMRRDTKHKVMAITEGLPSVRGLRVDQLLTSEYFGLSSTVDPDLDKLFKEYYHLLATPEHNAEQTARIAELKAALDGYKVLGTNRRERLMLEVIDQFLADEPEISDETLRQALTAETKERVRQIWAEPAKA